MTSSSTDYSKQVSDIFWKLSCYPGSSGISPVEARKAAADLITEAQIDELEKALAELPKEVDAVRAAEEAWFNKGGVLNSARNYNAPIRQSKELLQNRIKELRKEPK